MNIRVATEQDLDKIIASHFSKLLKEHRIFAFYGEMGAGKTTFINRLLKYLNVEVSGSSPTYSIVNEYLSKDHQQIYHLDCYRLESEEEAYDFGIEEYWDTADYIFIEWPERIEGILPEHIAVVIDVFPSGEREMEVDVV